MTPQATPRYALNIADLTRYDAIMRSVLIAPHIQGRETVDPEPARVDGDCIILECPTDQAKAIIELLRTVVDKRARQYPIRAYQSGPRGGWRRV